MPIAEHLVGRAGELRSFDELLVRNATFRRMVQVVPASRASSEADDA